MSGWGLSWNKASCEKGPFRLRWKPPPTPPSFPKGKLRSFRWATWGTRNVAGGLRSGRGDGDVEGGLGPLVFRVGPGCGSYIQSISTADPAKRPGEGDSPVVSWDPSEGDGDSGPLTPFSSSRAALSRRVRRAAVRMRALEASQRPPTQRPRASQPPRSQNIYSACPRRARAADAEGEPGAGRRGDRRPGRAGATRSEPLEHQAAAEIARTPRLSPNPLPPGTPAPPLGLRLPRASGGPGAGPGRARGGAEAGQGRAGPRPRPHLRLLVSLGEGEVPLPGLRAPAPPATPQVSSAPPLLGICGPKLALDLGLALGGGGSRSCALAGGHGFPSSSWAPSLGRSCVSFLL